MKYYTLHPADGNSVVWVIYEFHAEGGGLKLRPQYADLKCSVCGKVDEDAALARGIDSSVRVRSRRDYLETGEELICVSARFAEVLARRAIRGAGLFPLPGQRDRFILVPDRIVPVEEQASKMELRGRCERCGRYRETLYTPLLQSMLPLPEDKWIFRPSINSESIRGSRTWVMAGQCVLDILKEERITGIDPVLIR